MNPREYSEREIRELIRTADLQWPWHAWGREGPLWGTYVYFYTDYENDKVKTFSHVESNFIKELEAMMNP